MSASALIVGIDVGAPTKGYHVVALRGTVVVGKLQSSDAAETAQWCVTQEAEIVSVDAPCRWRADGGAARLAERELAAERISCFSTPTEAKARGHTFYTWMCAGQKLYAALAPHYPIYTGRDGNTRVAIETFPQAVACALAGGIIPARRKFAVRGGLLRRSGIDAGGLKSVDEVDAALCALAASAFVSGTFKSYGDSVGGFIIVPRSSAATERELTVQSSQPVQRPSHQMLLRRSGQCQNKFRI